MGFGMAALVGIPLGFMIGRFAFLNRMVSPLISLLQPVSPLAWLPIGLLVFKAANPAAIWTIFICSIWPMVINTAVGVQRVPQDYLNVARVLNLSEWKVIATRILLPAVLPYMLTGVRLSVGTAWLVIVAAEMLTGGVGIGFWVWDEWNNLNVKHIIIAIFVIGIVGLAARAAADVAGAALRASQLKGALSHDNRAFMRTVSSRTPRWCSPRRRAASIALRDIDLDVDQGEFVTLIGHSGCGKSHAAEPDRRPDQAHQRRAAVRRARDRRARARSAAWCSRTIRCCPG